MTAEANVSAWLRHWSERTPERDAIVGTEGHRVTFAGLEARCERIAAGLRELGLGDGDRTLLFVPPGHELIALTHALFRTGAVPVLIDPGMGRQALLACVRNIRPRALIGIPRAHVARTIFPAAFRSVDIAVTVGRRLGWPGVTLADIEARPHRPALMPPTSLSTEAAILFTSGSTGPPKGVVYTHGIFQAQLAALAELYGLRAGEVDVACFPLFALFDNALGMTSVFPELDASRPGTCDPRKVHAVLEREGATFTFGSPAIWRRVLAWAERSGARFSTLRRVTIAGAPVPPRLIAGLRELLPPGGEVHTPYGATEALPVANLSGADLAAGIDARTEGGEGTCVGRLAPNVEVRILRITDEALESFTPELELPAGEVGEICVRGPVATPAYKFDDEATRLAKIHEPDGSFWHRMGDVGRFDEQGRLWFLGRKSHRLETARGTLFPVPFENVCNTLPGVRRTALVGVGERGQERPCLIVEAQQRSSRGRVRELVTSRAAADGLDVPVERVLFKRSFPVDVRHNAKIKRNQLKRWAEGKRT